MPLMPAVGLGALRLCGRAMMAPTAIGSITAKTFAMKILNRFGYRVTSRVTVRIGLMIAQFALQTPTLPLWMLILLFMLGMAMSTQIHGHEQHHLSETFTEDAGHRKRLALRNPAAFHQLRRGEQHRWCFGSTTRSPRGRCSIISLYVHHHRWITMIPPSFSCSPQGRRRQPAPGRKKPVFETDKDPTPRNP